MIENESTGIRELDQILYGGINGGETVLFMHDIGSGYELILLEIIRNHYHQGGNVLLVVTSPSSLRFLSLFEGIINLQNFKIIDCISPRNVYNTEYYIANYSQLFDIFLAMQNARNDLLQNSSKNEPTPLVCFYSLSPLFINFGENEVIQFFNKNIREAMRCRTIEYYLLSQGVTNIMVERRIQALANTVILSRTEFRDHRRQNYLQILKHASGVPYPEEKQYSIIKRDGTLPEIIFLTPILDSITRNITRRRYNGTEDRTENIQ
ncbi:MAG: hypothetical protein ACUVXA_10815 [Candidatus Jordarchaeum sp.]|uniref:hypothetical protein n=1 Tax=Candidatus Jordarchaeum sp. TaxID=2823881 RepID=UPI00404B7BB4